MSNMNLLHKSLESTYRHTLEICSPFLQQYDLSFFMYGRFYQEPKSLYGLMTDPGWSQYGTKKNILLNPPKIQKDLKRFSFFSFWEGLVSDETVKAINDYGIYYPLAYIELTADYCDVYAYGSHQQSNHSLMNVYLNNLERFRMFNQYFIQKASSLLKIAEKSKIQLPRHPPTSINKQFLNKMKNLTSLNQLMGFEFERVNFSSKALTQLSKQEFKCLKQIANGRTAKESARLMNCSHRTIQNYIYNMKNKLGVHRKGQLIDLYYANTEIDDFHSESKG